MNITICAAAELLDKVAALKPAAVLSIEHPGVAIGDKGYAPRLTDSTPQKILTFWDTEQPNVAGGPTKALVEEGFNFIMDHIAEGDVIIHCQEGIARSTALALGVMARLYPEASETALVEQLLQMRPQAGPNILVVEMLDQITGRGGRLVAAVKKNPQMKIARAEAEELRLAWCEKNPGKFPGKMPKPMAPHQTGVRRNFEPA